ncbi:MAG: hypothetical protein KAI81_09860, partial [Candidatus Marinimicrobia bacterium]|nr:hypothetical protein [Candidatus Neomarinimicrobiota bacterium]
MKYVKITSLLLISFSILFAKEILDHDAYDIWLKINSKGINSNGSHLWYTASPDEKDGFLEIVTVDNNLRLKFERGDSLRFSRDGNFAAFLIRPPRKLTEN